MIDFTLILGFDWDDGNSRKNEKHGVSGAEAEQVFLDSQIVVTSDIDHSAVEARYQALGETLDRRRLHVSFTLRQNESLIRIISARDMNRKERARYENQA